MCLNCLDDKIEMYVFIEVGWSVLFGGLFKGVVWCCVNDVLGVVVVVNMLGLDYCVYLVVGGSGVFFGDGGLNYGYECVLELFYSL